MLLKLDEQIRQAYEHAEDCGQQEKSAASPEERGGRLSVEARWLTLTGSLEFTRHLKAFPTKSSGTNKPFLFRQSRYATWGGKDGSQWTQTVRGGERICLKNSLEFI
jgi:hypothetical protein